MKANTFFFVGRAQFEAFDNGAFESYEEAVDFQTNINARMIEIGRVSRYSIYEAKIAAHNLLKIQ